MTSPLTPGEQFQALNILEYVSDLFTGSPKETFTREEILVILNCVRNDPEMFDPDVVIAQEQTSSQIDSQPS